MCSLLELVYCFHFLPVESVEVGLVFGEAVVVQCVECISNEVNANTTSEQSQSSLPSALTALALPQPQYTRLVPSFASLPPRPG